MNKVVKNIFCKCFDRIALLKYKTFDVAEITSGSAFVNGKFHGTVMHYYNKGDGFIEQDIVRLRSLVK